MHRCPDRSRLDSSAAGTPCAAMPTIADKQAALVAEFAALPDWESRYQRIIALAKGLAALPDEHRVEGNRVRGCSSTVWLWADLQDGVVTYRADSDAVLVRGLVALLVQVYSGHPPAEILAAKPAFIEQLGLNQNLSPNRANGLTAMVKQIMIYALAYQAKLARGN
jgi:cysteine desulfuration protein SufE